MIRLIVSDMDGTLLNEKLEISETNARAIRRAQDHGIEFMVATGRDYTSGNHFLKQHGIKCNYIGMNGGLLYDESGQLKDIQGLEKHSVLELIEALENYSVYYEVMTQNKAYSNDKGQHLRHLAAMLLDINPDLSIQELNKMKDDYLASGKVKFVENYQDVVNQKTNTIMKISVQSLSGPQKLQQIRQIIEDHFEGMTVTASSQKNLEINHAEASKGNALAKFAKAKGYRPEEVMTLGDNLNDLSMISWAKYGIAMANAVPKVKATATYLTSSNTDNGVAEAISRVLNQKIYKD